MEMDCKRHFHFTYAAPVKGLLFLGDHMNDQQHVGSRPLNSGQAIDHFLDLLARLIARQHLSKRQATLERPLPSIMKADAEPHTRKQP
jgi:hypothetical protein